MIVGPSEVGSIELFYGLEDSSVNSEGFLLVVKPAHVCTYVTGPIVKVK